MPPQLVGSQTLWIRNQYDTAPPLRAILTDDDGNPMNLEGVTVTVDIAYWSYNHYYAPRGRIVSDFPCTTTAVPGEVSYRPESWHFDIPGNFHVKFKVVYPDGTHQVIPSSYPLGLRIHERIGGLWDRGLP